MWLLSTDRAELRHFSGPEAVKEGYVVLSHVWDREEGSFQLMKLLKEICDETGGNPLKLAPPKIQYSCILAAKEKHKWLWVDTVCINKKNSSELQEAIGSMYRYYSLATACYAFLRDVSTPDNLDTLSMPESEFYRSRWHQRGWILQELIAPKQVYFVSSSWTIFGGKTDSPITMALEEITKIPASILLGITSVNTVSISLRMSWAASRETARVEDRAYSLMGLFGLRLPVLYGEGSNAFRRLQEELMRISADTSIYVWGPSVGLAAALEKDSSTISGDEDSDGLANQCSPHDEDFAYLLAPSPSYFKHCISASALFTPARRASASLLSTIQDIMPGTSPKPRSSFQIIDHTPYGIHARVLIIRIQEFLHPFALLSCHLSTDSSNPELVGLFISACFHAIDPRRPLYHCAAGQKRLITMTADFLTTNTYTATWEDIYLTHWRNTHSY